MAGFLVGGHILQQSDTSVHVLPKAFDPLIVNRATYDHTPVFFPMLKNMLYLTLDGTPQVWVAVRNRVVVRAF